MTVSSEHHRGEYEGQISEDVFFQVDYKLNVDIVSSRGDYFTPPTESRWGFVSPLYQVTTEEGEAMDIEPFIDEIDRSFKSHLFSEYNLNNITII